ncbi:MAG: Uma2 family endonuclease [Planctomycetia bacterium]|nr:Uma2 family endonuclease [Planctomycetia bacterium]
MSTSTRITVEQYDAMIRRGDFEPREEHHVELIYGEITPMGPIGLAQDNAVDELTEWSFESLPRRAVWVRVQGSFGIPLLDSVPHPDLAWLHHEDHSARRPTPEDVLLVVEVSDSSLPKDRGLKARLYAEAGVADYWIVNINDRCVEVRRDPQDSSYRSVEVFTAGQDVRPLAFPDVALPVDRVFPA